MQTRDAPGQKMPKNANVICESSLKAHYYFKMSGAIFLLFVPFLFQKFWRCLFFSWIKFLFYDPKSTSWFFFLGHFNNYWSQCVYLRLYVDLAFNASFHMNYSLLDWLEIWSIFFPKRRIVESASLCSILLPDSNDKKNTLLYSDIRWFRIYVPALWDQMEFTMRTNLAKTLDQLIFCKYTLHFEQIY